MVVSWLVKVVLVLGVLGLLVIDIGAPFIARAQADDAAHEVANEAALVFGPGQNLQGAKDRCAEVADSKEVELIQCEYVNGEIRVTVEKDAYSLLLERIPPLESWYDVRVSASATPK